MLYLVLFILLMAIPGVLMLLSPDFMEDPPGRKEHRTNTGGARRVSAPTTLEGALVTQLISREITPHQYATALARLAARDDRRSPLSVPEDDGPDACV